MWAVTQQWWGKILITHIHMYAQSCTVTLFTIFQYLPWMDIGTSSPFLTTLPAPISSSCRDMHAATCPTALNTAEAHTSLSEVFPCYSPICTTTWFQNRANTHSMACWCLLKCYIFHRKRLNWYQCYLTFFGFLLQSLLHIHSLYFPHNPWPWRTMSPTKAFIPDHLHYTPLVVATVCCHCYPTLFFPTKETELNEMLHFQFQFIWIFIPAIGIQLSSFSQIKEAFNICYFSLVKILMCCNQDCVWSF